MQSGRSYEVIEERYLVAAARAGSTCAYDELARRYRGATVLLALRTVGSRDAAQDVAQEALLAAYRQIHQLKDPRLFGPWLRTIAKNLAKAALRRECREQTMETADMKRLTCECEAASEWDPLESLLRNERFTAINRLVEALPQSVQIVLQLYYTEQWSVARIAEFLSLTKTTVKWRLHSGRKQVSRMLSETMADEAPVGPGPIAAGDERGPTYPPE